MHRRPFGVGGPAVSIIGQGTWQLERDPKAAVRALRRGVELGVDHIDTAEIYGDGAVERLVGEAIDGMRRDVFLVSKIEPSRALAGEALRACEQSLTRLRTDYLDAYLLHWLPPHPLEEAVEAMVSLVSAGMVRRWGVSNFDEHKLEAALGAAGPDAVVCNQILYHPGERAVEHAVIPACQRHGIAAVGYSPFAAGALSTARGAGRVLRDVAADLGATPRQVALAFLTRLPGTFTIPRTASVAHVEENAGAAALTLAPDHVDRICSAYPLDRPRGGVPMW